VWRGQQPGKQSAPDSTGFEACLLMRVTLTSQCDQSLVAADTSLKWTQYLRTAATAALMAWRASGATPAQEQFAKLCAGCHGEAATGTDRGPALINNRMLRSRPENQIRDLIRNGTQRGMPPFALPDSELLALTRWVRSLNDSAYDSKPAGNPQA